jgi:3-oxoacyl-[acyl-carrier-protein] synthase II
MIRTAESPRVVITGLGVICPLGSSPEELWSALRDGRSGIVPREQSRLGRNLPVPGVAEALQFSGKIDDFGELDGELKKAIRNGLKVMCRETQMAVASAQRALRHAGFASGQLDPERSGVVFGSDYMLTEPDEYSLGIRSCAVEDRFAFQRWGQDGMGKVTPLWLLKYLPNMPASHIAIFNDLRGPSNSLTHRENSSVLAIGEAARIIERGHADVMLAGSTGTRIHPMKGIHALQQEEIAQSDGDPAELARPFDRRRAGTVLGEGAGVVVLESARHAEARGATIFAEVTGFGASCVTSPQLLASRKESLINAMRLALRDAGTAPADIGHIHAHGLGTRGGDRDEATAIHAVWGPDAARTPVTAAKSYFGNLGAGSGCIELIGSILALREGELFPVRNLSELDPECPVNAIPEPAAAGKCFMKLSTTPQGQSSAIVVGLAS